MVIWQGKSGNSYNFNESNPPPAGINGNYIFVKQMTNGWNAIYIGQGNLVERYNAALLEGCVTQKGATHYHWHQNENENARTYEESDLIGHNLECMIRNGGCNKVQP